MKCCDKNKLTSFVFYISIILFLISFNFSDNTKKGWQLQLLPDLNGASIVDMTFTDTLNGYAVTSVSSSSLSHILKTSNGGNNWNIILSDSGRGFSRVQFLNYLTGYASTFYGNDSSKLFKTENGGANWIIIQPPGIFNEFHNISVVSSEEIWMTDINVFSGGVFRSTNSGNNWQNILPPDFSNTPDRIYMVNPRIGFISNGNNTQAYLKKTTNAGINWIDIPGGFGWKYVLFKDSLAGWKSVLGTNNFQKTTDGGLTWNTILYAVSGNPDIAINTFSIPNDSVIWGANFQSSKIYPNNSIRAVLFKSTDKGFSWSYQIPDTSYAIGSLNSINFTDKDHGWSYRISLKGVYTNSGGDSIVYPITDIENNSEIIPKNYSLFQNFPNPFNPSTTIKFSLLRSGFVKLKIMDMLGREVSELLSERRTEGNYEIKFNGVAFPSGIYFYSMIVDNKLIDTKKMILIK